MTQHDYDTLNHPITGRVEVEKPSGWEGFIIGVLFLLVIFA